MATRTEPAARTFIERLHAIERGDPDAIDAMCALFSDDSRLRNPMTKHHGGEVHGRAGIAEFWRNYRASFREVRSEFGPITTTDHSAGLFWRSRGTDAQGRSVDYEGVSLLEFDADMRIRRFVGYFDSAELQARAR